MKKTNRELWIRTVWYVFILFFSFGYIVLPFLYTCRQAFGTEDKRGLQIFIELFSNENQLEVIKNTIVLGVTSIITCGVLGTGLALYMTFYAGRLKKVLHIVLLLPMVIPGVIIVIAFLQLYGESGIITKGLQLLIGSSLYLDRFRGFGAILFVITYTQYVYFYLNVYVGLKAVDVSAMEAAKSMGASKRKIFRDIIWPVIAPAVVTSAVVTFAGGVSAFSAPNLIGGGFKVLSTQIVRSKANNYMEMASAQVIVLFIISVSFLLIMQWYGRRYKIHLWERTVPVSAVRERGSYKIWLIRIPVFFSVTMIVLPILGIIYLSIVTNRSIMTDIFPAEYTLEHYTSIFQKSRNLQPLLNSIQMSLFAVGLCLFATIPSGWYIVRGKDGFRKILRFVLMLPWTMPASVVGINLINTFGKGTIFSFFQPLIGGYYVLPIAYTILLLPVLLSTVEVAIKNLHPGLSDAAGSLGASSIQHFFHIVIPNVAPGIFAGGILGFIRTIGEYTISALLYGVHNRPISVSMVTAMQEYNIGTSLAYGVLVIGICCLTMAGVMGFERRKYF